MKRRKWSASEKAHIVLEGLKGRPVAEICNIHQISQSMYYAWRDKFHDNLAGIFIHPRPTNKELELSAENKLLRECIVDLTLELKKSEDL